MKKPAKKEQYITLPIWLIKMTSNKQSPFYITPLERELFCLIEDLAINNCVMLLTNISHLFF